MIQFNRSFYFFKQNETWFNVNTSWKKILTLNSYLYIDSNIKVNSFMVREKCYTLIIDLNEDIEQIKSKFNPTVKNEIKKGISNNIDCNFENNIIKFSSFFSEFANLKNLYQPKIETFQTLTDNFLTSFAKLNGEIIVAHSYIADPIEGVVRLFQSASKRLDLNYNISVISQANKLLTYHDIVYFKKCGYKLYDFGGFAFQTKNKSLLGINQFKKSFGGRLIQYYNYYTPLYYLLKIISQFLDRRY